MTLRDLLGGASRSLTAMHRKQVHRDPWPKFEDFDATTYPLELRAPAAKQWMRRAREELGSVYEFTALTHALSPLRPPVEILGGLSRLITDEVRHAEICGRMAIACYPEGLIAKDESLRWQAPGMPYAEPPTFDPVSGDSEPILRWAADVVLSSCCIGETLSRPLFESVAILTTDPICEQVIRQILRDEHLHATFGWETLAFLISELNDTSREWLQQQLARRFRGFESGAASGFTPHDLAGTEVQIERGDSPNLGTLTRRQYAQIFYSTLETVIFPKFSELGLDPLKAWSERGKPRA